jgi:Winged helix-turn helix
MPTPVPNTQLRKSRQPSLLGRDRGDRNSPQKHACRARTVLRSADGVGTVEIMRTAGVSKTAVWRWRERFMQEGVDGLLRDKTRPSRIPPLGPEVADRVVSLTLQHPTGEDPLDGRTMAKLSGISVSSVQRIWRLHGLQPHRVRQFKLSKDPQFAAKVRDIVGLYVDPPAHTIVLSMDGKSRIQALDRTQPSLPLKKGRAGTYKRHGTTTLFAALDVLEGTVIGASNGRADMTGHRSFKELRKATSPERQARNAEQPKACFARWRSANSVRRGAGRRPISLKTCTSDNRPSRKMEQRTDMYVSNLRRYIETLGGTLEISAPLPGRPDDDHEFQRAWSGRSGGVSTVQRWRVHQIAERPR